MSISLCSSVFRGLYETYLGKNNLNAQCGARTHDPEIKSLMLWSTELTGPTLFTEVCLSDVNQRFLHLVVKELFTSTGLEPTPRD